MLNYEYTENVRLRFMELPGVFVLVSVQFCLKRPIILMGVHLYLGKLHILSEFENVC